MRTSPLLTMFGPLVALAVTALVITGLLWAADVLVTVQAYLDRLTVELIP